MVGEEIVQGGNSFLSGGTHEEDLVNFEDEAIVQQDMDESEISARRPEP